MSRTLQVLDWFALSCLLLRIGPGAGRISPPQNVSLVWISDFQLQLSWAPPRDSGTNCRYEVFTRTKEEASDQWNSDATSPETLNRILEGGFLHSSVKTVCNQTESVPVVLNATYPDLVRNLRCSISSSKQTHCTWIPSSPAADLRFFYKLVKQNGPDDGSSASRKIQECLLYRRRDDGAKTGCDLQATTSEAIHILFNGTLNNTLVRNTFKSQPKDDVQPPPLTWTVEKRVDHFIISWTPPDLVRLQQWTFIINYTECNENESLNVTGRTSHHLVRVAHCPYSIAIKAVSTKGATPWSETKHFDRDHNVLVYAAVITPVVIAILAALTFACCRKNKETIFPDVPTPRNFLSDIANNNKSTLLNWYVPADEEENCKITLVTDPQISKSDC